MFNDDTQIGSETGHFRTTRWSLISEIRDLSSDSSKKILNDLFRDYWKPVYCYIRNSGVDNEKAKDLTQEFFCSVVFEKNLFAKAQRSKGKFRSLLLVSLKNFLVSRNRYQTAQKRASCKDILSIDQLGDPLSLPCDESFQDDEGFLYTWITSLLDNVSEQVRRQYLERGKELHWAAFDKRFWEPTLHNKPAPSLSAVCKAYGIADEVKASTMVASVKRSFQKKLRSRVREYVYSDSDVDDELDEMMGFLRKYVQD